MEQKTQKQVMMKTQTTSKPLNHGNAQAVSNKLADSNKQKRKPLGPVPHRLIRDMSNEAYHGSSGTWSSSQLKAIIDDEELFIQQYIKKTIPKQSSEAMDTGTYLHTGILEPHKLAKEIAVYPGKTKYGKAWLEFKEKNKGKMIIDEKQKALGDGMIKAVKNSPVAMEHLKGDPEISLFNEILIANGMIYAPNYGMVLTRTGWTRAKSIPHKGFKILVKTRADTLGETFLSDLKSTSGRANKAESIRQAISKYQYDLSAALYLDMFALIRPEVTAFIWIFASKNDPIAGTWIASERQIMVGRAKWMWAVKRLADLSAANWEVVDYLREAEPLSHELDWLIEKTTDLL